MKQNKSKLTKEDVIKIAKLAKLQLKEKEIEKFRHQLLDVLEYIGKLYKLDTTNVSPTNQVTGLSNIIREDKVTVTALTQVEALSNASQTENNMFKVPAIFED